ncbi:MAG: exonuclease SbcCD subunit D [Bacilli bacterium]|nr:exonuclease SbcCD subunit D [Bacilli bacterium]
MKILHLADLHLGKRICGYSLIDDQRFFLNQTLRFLDENNIKCLIIAGDIYDLSIPSAEATTILDEFLSALADKGIQVLMIPGNHDSSNRLSYASNFFKNRGIHIVTDAKNSLSPIAIDDVNFYLVPFLNHHDVNRVLETDFKDYESAMRGLVEAMKIDDKKTNVLIAHQLVLPTKGELSRSGSEEITIGTLGNISASTLYGFDYVALGHIHKPQNVGHNMRYPGSPLKYHSDEANIEKSYTVVSVDGKNVSYETMPIRPLRDVVVLKGKLEDIVLNNASEKDNYVYAILTNETSVENAMEKLKRVFPHALNLEYERIIGQGVSATQTIDVQEIPLTTLFADFYEQQNGRPLSKHQEQIVSDLLEGGSNNETS